MASYAIEKSQLWRFVFADTRMALVWLVVRLYLGWEWLNAGWEKATNPAWVGADAGAALNGFVQGALKKTVGVHPDVQGWYASFLQDSVLSHLSVWSHLVAYGEVFVGLGLIVGCFVGVAAFFGVLMNLSFLLAGTVSVNPILLVIGIVLMLAWRTAGYIGLDRYALPILRKMWRPRKYR